MSQKSDNIFVDATLKRVYHVTGSVQVVVGSPYDW